MDNYLLNTRALKKFKEEGFLISPYRFSATDLVRINDAVNEILALKVESDISEEGLDVSRTIRGLHLYHPLFSKLFAHPALCLPARQILQSEVYVNQNKLNTKAAFHGKAWEWHQDQIHFKKLDGLMQAPLNVALMLDAVTEFNAPLCVIPKSHKIGTIDVSSKNDGPTGILSASTKLKYSADLGLVSQLAEQHGLHTIKGPSGTVFFFHSDLFHCSSNNMSPWDRKLLIISYNAISNKPQPHLALRPAYMANTDYTPIIPKEIEF